MSYSETDSPRQLATPLRTLRANREDKRPSDSPDPDGFLGPNDFAELLDVSVKLFHKIKSMGQIFPAEYFGRLPRWWRPHIRLWILNGRPVGDDWERVKRSWTEKQMRSWV